MSDRGGNEVGGRRTTSVCWPVVVDERLRLLARLSAREGERSDDGSPVPTPSAARVLANLILQQPLTEVAGLGREPGPEVLAEAQRVNESYAWLEREPWFGRPRWRAASSARRVVQSGVKGWRLPVGGVSVAGSSRWGNPWGVVRRGSVWFVEQPRGVPRRCGSREAAYVAARGLFEGWLDGELGVVTRGLEVRRRRVLEELPVLEGKVLACFCPEGLACHGDVLLVRANPWLVVG